MYIVGAHYMAFSFDDEDNVISDIYDINHQKIARLGGNFKMLKHFNILDPTLPKPKATSFQLVYSTCSQNVSIKFLNAGGQLILVNHYYAHQNGMPWTKYFGDFQMDWIIPFSLDSPYLSETRDMSLLKDFPIDLSEITQRLPDIGVPYIEPKVESNPIADSRCSFM
jgi:hypothetical protein